MSDELLDARGVEIESGDTVVYGFGVGRSVAMAEGVVLGNEDHYEMAMMRDGFGVGPAECSCGASHPCPLSVSLTPTGLVRVRIVRRSYSSGEQPVVTVRPDRLVVLKLPPTPVPWEQPSLPPSPLPTQDEQARARIEELIRSYTADLKATETPAWWGGCRSLAEFHTYAARRLKELRGKLKKLDEGGV